MCLVQGSLKNSETSAFHFASGRPSCRRGDSQVVRLIEHHGSVKSNDFCDRASMPKSRYQRVSATAVETDAVRFPRDVERWKEQRTAGAECAQERREIEAMPTGGQQGQFRFAPRRSRCTYGYLSTDILLPAYYCERRKPSGAIFAIARFMDSKYRCPRANKD